MTPGASGVRQRGGAAKVTWTEKAVCALGVKTDIATAGSIFGMCRTESYEAVKRGDFPVPVVRVGRRMFVPVAPIRRLLEIDPARSAPPDLAATTLNAAPAPEGTTTNERTSAA